MCEYVYYSPWKLTTPALMRPTACRRNECVSALGKGNRKWGKEPLRTARWIIDHSRGWKNAILWVCFSQKSPWVRWAIRSQIDLLWLFSLRRICKNHTARRRNKIKTTSPLLLKSFFRLQTCGKHLIIWTSKQIVDLWTNKCWHQLQERPANVDKPILNVSILQTASCVSMPMSCCNCGPSAPHSFWFSNHFTCAWRWPGGQAAACV